MEGLCPHSQGGLSLTHLHRLPHGHKEREGRVLLRHHHVATCASLAGGGSGPLLGGGDLTAAAQPSSVPPAKITGFASLLLVTQGM